MTRLQSYPGSFQADPSVLEFSRCIAGAASGNGLQNDNADVFTDESNRSVSHGDVSPTDVGAADSVTLLRIGVSIILVDKIGNR